MAWAWEALVVLLLILANAAFAAGEMAVITARAGRLEHRMWAGDWRAAVVLGLVEHRERLPAAVRIGVTLTGTLAPACSGTWIVATLAQGLRTKPLLQDPPVPAPCGT